MLLPNRLRHVDPYRLRHDDLVAVVLAGGALLAVVLDRRLGLAAVVTAAVTVPLVIADVRRRLLPNVLTLPVLLAGAAEAFGQGWSAAAAVLATVLALAILRLAGGLGTGDVKLGAGLALTLAAVDPLKAASAPALAFLLAGIWTLPLASRGDRSRIAFGPFQLAAFWIVVSAP